MKPDPPYRTDRAVAGLLAAWTAFLIWLTLFTFPKREPGFNLTPFSSIRNDWSIGGRELIVNFVGNVVAFLPIGILPALAFGRARVSLASVTLAGATLSLLIESAQYVSGRRMADVDDVLLNTIGTALGFVLYDTFRRRAPAEGPKS